MAGESHTGSDGPEGKYANYFKIGHNAFEFVVDFAQRYDDGETRCHTRIVTAPRYAKALYVTLRRAVTQYESTFGPIEDGHDEDTEPQKT